MSKLITVVGPSGIGKTTLVNVLAKAYPFVVAYEDHIERSFQALFKQDARYALANQIDYLLLCAEQEKHLRALPSTRIGLMDGGLDLDFHGFTRLFHRRRFLTDAEFDLCWRLYKVLREALLPPELIIRLHADESVIARRLSTRDRINIASAEDTALFNSFLDDWLATVPAEQILELDVSDETPSFTQTVHTILNRIRDHHILP